MLNAGFESSVTVICMGDIQISGIEIGREEVAHMLEAFGRHRVGWPIKVGPDSNDHVGIL
jgi:hypothetical protein